MYFDPGLEIKDVMRAVHNPDVRSKWDRDVESADILSIVNNKLMLWH
jgi:hypothetical protein